MKKILTLICCTILIAATSCTKKYITPANVTAFYDVKGTSGWVVSTDSGGKTSYSSTLNNLPENDNYSQANGGVLVYISYDNGATYEALPETYNGIAYSYTYSVGKVILYAQNSNGTQLSAAPSLDIKVKVVLVDSTPA
ncbi:hypothetical protein [Mucilaginibacter flavus]|uniref:hypothetical protein n=1 Tax=Mucilaginibacter flavus TaxID=931504 RepID=UPI0025B3C277|nr:hypothetical protein [Mucilaginibacter flavus]MDN3581069.1 hypothetical protein [Mucilaginibacter flavus]